MWNIDILVRDNQIAHINVKPSRTPLKNIYPIKKKCGHIIEVFVKSFKEGPNHGFASPLRKLYIKIPKLVIHWNLFKKVG